MLGLLVLTMVFVSIGGVFGRILVYAAGMSAAHLLFPSVTTIVGALVTCLIWLIFNHFYLRITVGLHGFKRQQLVLLLPMVVILIGDSTLPTQFDWTGTNVLLALGIGLAVGMLEEYVFRGLLVNGLRQLFQVTPLLAALASGAIFGLAHLTNLLGNSNSLVSTCLQVIYAFAGGFFLAIIYIISGSLWLPILAHAVVTAFDQIAFGTMSNQASSGIWTTVLYFGIFTGLGFWLWARKIRRQVI
ncbi:abortive infection protein [Agrilactobacillus composti DSM 18527 = JCM 14202]|uniref:Abortive infection protein n=2 Tax=Agrilactobacillus TaxID=2767875 RepID=X0QJ06_9LACO|nr:abortive infection protein [Agrilactobacillus composti DSM 18527 = JCM 14202]GAF38580.1 hypothetical protein JCM14202_396 [Agrilactobacillus composti DSM 18527 = JCM 14202]